MNFKEALEVIKTEANLYPEDSLDRATWLEVYEVFKNAIPLDEVEQAREEMKECSYSLRCFNEDVFDEDERVVDLDNVLIILDKLIESVDCYAN